MKLKQLYCEYCGEYVTECFEHIPTDGISEWCPSCKEVTKLITMEQRAELAGGE